MHNKTLINVLGVVYYHLKTRNGGDLYLTEYADKFHKHLNIGNWYEKRWFDRHKTRLKGTGSVFKVPTKKVNGKSLDLVVKNCRVGEDVPLDTHTLEEFCNAEFNSPWEEFSLVSEMKEGLFGPENLKMKTQRPMAIYVPPGKMQPWQSGRSRDKINKIRARHPGIDLDILKQYKLVYQWIDGLNIVEIFEHINIERNELLYHLKILDQAVTSDIERKGYHVADSKPEHIIISRENIERIMKSGRKSSGNPASNQISYLYKLIENGKYSVIDYELLLRTLKHDTLVKESKRHSYLDYQRDRFTATPLPGHLRKMEIHDVPYIYGHTESTGGKLWVVGNNALLFDYFLPERWRKTPSIGLSGKKETFYTITKDNVHLVWRTSRVGELPEKDDEEYDPLIQKFGINSPFEESAIALELTKLKIPCAYVRAIYKTASYKMEMSFDQRRYESHKNIFDPEGRPVLQEEHNYILIRGYYNGPDEWVARQSGPLYKRISLAEAVATGILEMDKSLLLLEKVKVKLEKAGYIGTLLKLDDLVLSLDNDGSIVKDNTGSPLVVICNFEYIWKILR
ncbi:MAG TPA: hypothetical protein ENH01_13435 [Nitrospirae bacterium]|nr:hypothetical protein BMS3Abin09_00432 [bacterium BMS3Abin09]GBE40574.1 hypothetical protein BMS3Bbin09_00460 [bacterium BMS3Bbin09]HDH06679.1 hypothetical protein [Nitrospirota bacterium]HDH34918.1 hypothetical protein [Nitrospirota bacterium]